MLPDRVSNPGPLTYESGALPIALRGPAGKGVWKKNEFVPFSLLGNIEMNHNDDDDHNNNNNYK